MINANEIRIGNMITYCPTGKLTMIDYEHVNSFIKDSEEYNPIPLKPGILAAAGFEEMEGDNWKISHLPFQLCPNELEGYHYDLGDGGKRNVTSLHQLQNLYFALTDEELNIKLTV